MEGNHSAGLTSEDLDAFISGLQTDRRMARPPSDSSDQAFVQQLINTARSAYPDATSLAHLDAEIQRRLRLAAKPRGRMRIAISRVVIRSLVPSRQLTVALATVALVSAFIVFSMSGWAAAGQRSQLNMSSALIGEQDPEVLVANTLMPQDTIVASVANTAMHHTQAGNTLTQVTLSAVQAPLPPTTPLPTRPTRVDTFTTAPVGP